MKGLGRSEQGCTDHIKVKLKNDSYGLGANASYEVSYEINMFIYNVIAPEKQKIVKSFFNVDIFFFFFCRTTGLPTKMILMNFLLSWTTTMAKTKALVCHRSIHFLYLLCPHVGDRGLLESLPVLNSFIQSLRVFHDMFYLTKLIISICSLQLFNAVFSISTLEWILYFLNR